MRPSLLEQPIIERVEEPGERSKTRILVADDHDIVCAGLERMIDAQPDMKVCGIAKSGAEAVEKVKSLNPDVVILDIKMAGLSGLETSRELRRERPQCEVLLFTGIETDELMRQAFASGAKSFILKSDAQTHLLDAVRSLAQHKPFFTNKVSEVILARLLQRAETPSPEGAPSGRLSARELEIVKRLALGDGNREVAASLGVNLRTAEAHRAALMKKMNFESLADLVRYAVRNGIIEV